ncbi:MAG: NTP transferase domain-containing protein [Cellulomonadaceae bacterium]|nr:NTP transferase domain-containing protein [Cellulomonadaceae bacterium]
MPTHLDSLHDDSLPDGCADSAGRFDAIIVAGGRGSRLGGVDKAAVVIGDTTLLDRALAAVAGAAQVAVVGRDLRCSVSEFPSDGGPVAGIAAGLSALNRDDAPAVVVLLAVDIPDAASAVPLLCEALRWADNDVDGACLTRDGHPQWLVSALRCDRLNRALNRLRDDAGSMRNQSVRRLAGMLTLHLLPDTARASEDVDTWADHARIQARIDRDRFDREAVT